MKQIKNSFQQVLYQVRDHDFHQVKNSVNFYVRDRVANKIWVDVHAQIRIISYDAH